MRLQKQLPISEINITGSLAHATQLELSNISQVLIEPLLVSTLTFHTIPNPRFSQVLFPFPSNSHRLFPFPPAPIPVLL